MSTYGKIFTVRLPKDMRIALQSHAERVNKSESRVIKDFIKSLESKNKEVTHEKTN